ncbi:homoserine dehydrogenase [Salinicoccus siamensis]|uniref:Homoserine dehydrogenase n=1 Tax=Salinicoccus siamensis TaxID=381830 RepID=A0ABV5Z3J7_9STAP
MKVAILGMGTVGSGVMEIIQMNRPEIERQIGTSFSISHVLVRDRYKERGVELGGVTITDDVDEIHAADIDVVAEVMGGVASTRDMLLGFLQKGVHVISANKDMLAEHIDELSEAANRSGAMLMYEASVAGGIPIINGISQGLNANRIQEVMGILNGTTNYILTKMTGEGWDYEKALDAAKEKGYAEADPTNDVAGFDAQRKIVLLSRLAYNRKVDIGKVGTQGIDSVELGDIKAGSNAGLTMKLIGRSAFHDDQLSIEVAPVFLPDDHQLSSVSDEKNAVYIRGNAVGETMFYGPGAGGRETASAVVSDLISCLRRMERVEQNLVPAYEAAITEDVSPKRFYIRFTVDEISAREQLSQHGIDYELIERREAAVVITSAIKPEKLRALVENNDSIYVTYKVEGD